MRIKFNIFAQASASKYNYLAFFAQNTESNKEAIGYLANVWTKANIQNV